MGAEGSKLSCTGMLEMVLLLVMMAALVKICFYVSPSYLSCSARCLAAHLPCYLSPHAPSRLISLTVLLACCSGCERNAKPHDGSNTATGTGEAGTTTAGDGVNTVASPSTGDAGGTISVENNTIVFQNDEQVR